MGSRCRALSCQAVRALQGPQVREGPWSACVAWLPQLSYGFRWDRHPEDAMCWRWRCIVWCDADIPLCMIFPEAVRARALLSSGLFLCLKTRTRTRCMELVRWGEGGMRIEHKRIGQSSLEIKCRCWGRTRLSPHALRPGLASR